MLEAVQDLKSATEAVRQSDLKYKDALHEKERLETQARGKEESLQQEKQQLDAQMRHLDHEREEKIRQVDAQAKEAMRQIEQAFSMRKATLESEIKDAKTRLQQLDQNLTQINHERREAEQKRAEFIQKTPHVA